VMCCDLRNEDVWIAMSFAFAESRDTCHLLSARGVTYVQFRAQEICSHHLRLAMYE
jgi:hypothetical protein